MSLKPCGCKELPLDHLSYCLYSKSQNIPVHRASQELHPTGLRSMSLVDPSGYLGGKKCHSHINRSLGYRRVRCVAHFSSQFTQHHWRRSFWHMDFFSTATSCFNLTAPQQVHRSRHVNTILPTLISISLCSLR